MLACARRSIRTPIERGPKRRCRWSPTGRAYVAASSLERAKFIVGTDRLTDYNDSRLVGLILGVIAEYVRQHLGIEDAARRRTKAPKYSCR